MHDVMSGREDSHPLVSVAMTAYNSGGWIHRAIQSVLSQDVTFPIEIVIGDDHSTDATASVVRRYQELHPGLIHLIERQRNVGMQRNYYETFERCRGTYVAWLDADDFWTDPDKLGLQVEALERDPSLSICGHFVRFVDPSGQVTLPRYPPRRAGRYTLRDLVLQNFVPSPSILFRGGLHHQLPPWYFDLSGISDWPMLLVGASRGDIMILDRVMASYTRTPGSAYNDRGFLHQHAIDFEVRKQMTSLLAPRWHRSVRAGIGRQYEALAYDYRAHGDPVGACEAAYKAFRTPDLRDNLVGKTKAIAAALVYRARVRSTRSGQRSHPSEP